MTRAIHDARAAHGLWPHLNPIDMFFTNTDPGSTLGGVRIGKVIPGGKGSWNLYAEYQTSLIYSDYPGAAKDSSWRFNITKTLPAGF